MRSKVGRRLAATFIALGSAALGQQNTPEQCSMAVVSQMAGGAQGVCDGKFVQQMAKKGHAYEQNQLGIASVLVIGPDFKEKEALQWFERAAHQGYAPAQVNLGVMYANG